MRQRDSAGPRWSCAAGSARPSPVTSCNIIAVFSPSIATRSRAGNLSVNLPLIVVPDATSWFRKYRSNRQEELQLFGFEYSALGIYQRDALTTEIEPGVQLGSGEMAVNFHEAANMLECRLSEHCIPFGLIQGHKYTRTAH